VKRDGAEETEEPSMKLQMAITFLTIALGMGVAETSATPSSKPEVAVCMNARNDLEAIMFARNLASRIFADAGVAIQWHGWNCPSDAIHISISYRTSPKLMPGTLAYASALEGPDIVVFYDRMKRTSESHRFPYMFGHVLVHEITHILQGVDHHSEEGLMKATWDWRDYILMDGRGLRFANEDIALIHRGLDGRARQLIGTHASDPIRSPR
jgi:hypothetical protein